MNDGIPLLFSKKKDADIGLSTIQHGTVYSFPKGLYRSLNGVKSRSADDFAAASFAIPGDAIFSVADALTPFSLGLRFSVLTDLFHGVGDCTGTSQISAALWSIQRVALVWWMVMKPNFGFGLSTDQLYDCSDRVSFSSGDL